jgi:endoglucanase
MRRRSLLAALPALLAAAPTAADAAAWRAFADRFLAPEGRIVDTGNGGVSHSEGQGWGLILAAAFDDRAAFERIRAWTATALARPRDALHAWRWRPGATPAVDDPNNATDGDLYIAWGLLMGAARWREPAWRAAALAIARDLLRVTLRRPQGRALLLPGAAGFESPEGMVVNPSYIVLPAFAALAREMPAAPWPLLARDGSDLLRRARFGAWGLSPDWALLPRDPALAPRLPSRWPPRFSFDAVRVPLLLAWAGQDDHPALRGAHAFWSDPRRAGPPAWIDLESGAVAGFPASAGVRAVAAFVAARIAGPGAAVPLPSINQSHDYYAASLTLLVRLACHATGTRIA